MFSHGAEMGENREIEHRRQRQIVHGARNRRQSLIECDAA
jgi:hypothetical protein